VRAGWGLPEACGGGAPGPHDHGLSRSRRLVDQVLDLVLADLDRVVVGQQLLLDGLAVDVGAVGAVEVFDEDVGAHHLQHGVLAADGQVVDHDVVVGTAAERGLVLRDLDFLDHHTVERNHQLAHACPRLCPLPAAADWALLRRRCDLARRSRSAPERPPDRAARTRAAGGAHQDHRDIILSARIVGGVDQRLVQVSSESCASNTCAMAASSSMSDRPSEHSRYTSPAARRAGGSPAAPCLRPHGAGDEVLVGREGRLLGRDQAGVDLFLQQRMVARDLLQPPGAQR
jgi:hypothetical protein